MGGSLSLALRLETGKKKHRAIYALCQTDATPTPPRAFVLHLNSATMLVVSSAVSPQAWHTFETVATKTELILVALELDGLPNSGQLPPGVTAGKRTGRRRRGDGEGRRSQKCDANEPRLRRLQCLRGSG